MCCICLCKDTNFKANHNATLKGWQGNPVVYAYAKILILKQITTKEQFNNYLQVVYAYAKILILKQITTVELLEKTKLELYMPMQRY